MNLEHIVITENKVLIDYQGLFMLSWVIKLSKHRQFLIRGRENYLDYFMTHKYSNGDQSHPIKTQEIMNL